MAVFNFIFIYMQTTNIFELQNNLMQDLDNWLNFEDCEPEEQKEICEAIASEEWNDDLDYYEPANDETIFIEASEKMGYIRQQAGALEKEKHGLNSREDLFQDRKNLHYNLSYSQGDYAYLSGRFDLIKLLEKAGEKELAKDLKFLDDYDLFRQEGRHYHKPYVMRVDNGEKFDFSQFIYILENVNCEDVAEGLEDAEGIVAELQACVDRVYNNIVSVIEQIFIDYEDDLKNQLYTDLEAEQEFRKQQWIDEVLRPDLKGTYNRATKQFKRECGTVYKI